MSREPLVLDTEDANHIEEILESLAQGYHVLGGDTPEKKQQYDGMLERFQDARPDFN